MYSVPNSGKIAFQWGLIFGLSLGVILSAISLINTLVIAVSGNAGISLLLSSLGFVLGLVAYFVAGILASVKTGKVSTGTVAGLWTAAIAVLIGSVVNLILFFMINLPRTLSAFMSSSSMATNIDTYRAAAIFGGIFFIIVAFACSLGAGAGLGALGGLIGKHNSKVAPQPTYPPYAGQPYPVQPGANYPYPGQPYPPQPYPGQPYPAQPYPGQSPDQPSQPYAGQPYPDQQNPYEPNP